MLSVYRDLSVGLSSVCTVYPSILDYILGFVDDRMQDSFDHVSRDWINLYNL